MRMRAPRIGALAVLLGVAGAPTVCSSFHFLRTDHETACIAADREPAFVAGATAEDWAMSDEVLSTFWADGDGYGGEEKGREFTYGEVTPKGVRQLAEALLASSCVEGEGHGVVFYDLG